MSCLLFLEEARGILLSSYGLFSELLAEVLAQSVDDTGHHFNRLVELIQSHQCALWIIVSLFFFFAHPFMNPGRSLSQETTGLLCPLELSPR